MKRTPNDILLFIRSAKIFCSKIIFAKLSLNIVRVRNFKFVCEIHRSVPSRGRRFSMLITEVDLGFLCDTVKTLVKYTSVSTVRMIYRFCTGVALLDTIMGKIIYFIFFVLFGERVESIHYFKYCSGR